MKKRSILFSLILIVLILTSCFPQSEAIVDIEPAGFWLGLWHGAIVLLSFFVSLFNDDVVIYAIKNTGHFYDLGFVLGLGAFGGSVSTTVSKGK
jgi:hypothetical protein